MVWMSSETCNCSASSGCDSVTVTVTVSVQFGIVPAGTNRGRTALGLHSQLSSLALPQAESLPWHLLKQSCVEISCLVLINLISAGGRWMLPWVQLQLCPSLSLHSRETIRDQGPFLCTDKADQMSLA